MASNMESEMPTVGTSANPTLLTLPPELRNRIFTLAVVSEEPIAARKFTSTGVRLLTTSVPAPPPIAPVCHQARVEILPLFFGCNTVWLDRNVDNPMEWHDPTVSYLPYAKKFLRSIVLQKEVTVGYNRRISGTPASAITIAVDIKLSLDDSNKAKISFPPSLGNLCSCEEENYAQGLTTWTVWDEISPVVLCAEYLHKFASVWRVAARGFPRQSKMCACGLQSENLNTGGKP